MVLTVLALGCYTPDGGRATASAYDSTTLRLLRELTIDRAEDAGLIRSVASLESLAGGRVLVGDEVGQRYLLLGASWEVLAAFGSAGQGPGEFQRPMPPVRLPGDSLLGVDWVTRRAAVYALSGEYARTFTWPQTDGVNGPFVPLGSISDGRVVLMHHVTIAPPGERLRLQVFIGAPTADPPQHLMDLPHLVPFAEGQARWGAILYSPAAMLALRRDQLFIGINDSSFIRILALPGGGERRVEHGLSRRQVSPADAAIEVDRRLALPSTLPPFAREAEAMRRAAIARTPAAEHHPFYSRMLVDPRLNIWLVWCDPQVPEACNATVIAADGYPVGTFPLPAGFVPYHIGEDHVIGVTDYDDRGRVIEIRTLPPGIQ